MASKTNVGQRKKKNTVGPPWEAGNFSPEPVVLHQPSYVKKDCTNWYPERYVQQYFDDDILSTIVEKTNQTHVLRTGKTMDLTLPELKIWLGINFVMSTLQYPKIRMYWEKKWRVAVIANAMSRDRFFY